MPREILEREIGSVARCDGRVFPPGSLQAVTLDAHIRGTLALSDGLASAAATVAGRGCLAMLAALLGTAEQAAKATPAQDQRLAKSVRSHGMGHIADPALGSASIGRALNLSRSRLYRVMSPSRDIAVEIRRLRPAAAHRDLASRESTDVPIGLVAQRWGFGQDRTFRRIRHRRAVRGTVGRRSARESDPREAAKRRMPPRESGERVG